MKNLYRKKTKVSDYKVSTVQFDRDIGLDRDAETMIFNNSGSGLEVYMESHGHRATKEKLDKEHERIVEALKKGELELYEEDA